MSKVGEADGIFQFKHSCRAGLRAPTCGRTRPPVTSYQLKPSGLRRRKGMGVEPTKDRPTAPPGFEVRTPHRGRVPSASGYRRKGRDDAG
jgi:hypothetical protein